MSRIVSCSRAREPGELVPHRGACLGVEARRRLVEEEDARPVHEAHRDVEAALLAARVRAHERVRLLAEREELEELVGARRSSVGPPHPLQASLEDEVLEPRGLAVDAGRLRHVADRAAYCAGLAAHVVPGDRGRAAVGRAQRDEDPDRRRFAGAVRPEQAEDLALGHRERHPVERADVLPVRLLEAVDDDRVHGGERTRRSGRFGRRRVKTTTQAPRRPPRGGRRDR